MRYLLDTCVVSDGAKPAEFPKLAEWLASQTLADLAIGALTVGELRYGIQRLPAGRKRERLKQWLDEEFLPRFRGRVLAVDAEASDVWGLLRASGDDAGRPLPVVDGLLLATAQTNGLTFVTRNIDDVEHRGVSVLGPY